MTEHAIDNAKAWFENIRAMVSTFNGATEGPEPGYYEARDEAERTIYESSLSVLVRSGWETPASFGTVETIRGVSQPFTRPVEYEILLSTGGPALRIVGGLDQYAEPTSAVLQWQDWGKPWTPIVSADYPEATLLSYASHFYFGG